MSTYEELHRLVDALPAEQARLVLAFLRERLGDPVGMALALAPLDDEPVSPQDDADLRQALEFSARGEVLTTEQLRAQLGLE